MTINTGTPALAAISTQLNALDLADRKRLLAALLADATIPAHSVAQISGIGNRDRGNAAVILSLADALSDAEAQVGRNIDRAEETRIEVAAAPEFAEWQKELDHAASRVVRGSIVGILKAASIDRNAPGILNREPQGTPYPTIAFDRSERGEIDSSRESIECVCGNDTSALGFSSADRRGLLGNLRAAVSAPQGLADLSEDEAWLSVCNVCGRVYDDDNLHLMLDSPVIARYDVTAPEWKAARALYVKHNDIG